MISLGIVFSDDNGNEVGSFLGDFKNLPGHTPDPNTMTEFWERDESNRAELARIRSNARCMFSVMKDLYDTIDSLNTKRIVWVARPAAYDWQWLNYYHNLYVLVDNTANLNQAKLYYELRKALSENKVI
jgi:hypothetical protein